MEDLSGDTSLVPPPGADRELRKVFGAFVKDGRIVTMPSRPERRRALLGLAVQTLEPGRTYDEQEVNRILMPLYDDYVSLRRFLVDADLLHRDGHGRYWRPS